MNDLQLFHQEAQRVLLIQLIRSIIVESNTEVVPNSLKKLIICYLNDCIIKDHPTADAPFKDLLSDVLDQINIETFLEQQNKSIIRHLPLICYN